MTTPTALAQLADLRLAAFVAGGRATTRIGRVVVTYDGRWSVGNRSTVSMARAADMVVTTA